MTAQEYNNQGFEQAATRHGYSPVLAELDRVNERCALEAAQNKQLAKYAPPIEGGQVQPYNNAGEAAMDLAMALGKPAIVLSVVAGAVYMVVAVVSMAVGAVFAFVSTYAVYIGGGVFALAAVVIGFGSLGGSKEQGGQTSQGAPIINVTVNVAGQNVNANTK